MRGARAVLSVESFQMLMKLDASVTHFLVLGVSPEGDLKR